MLLSGNRILAEVEAGRITIAPFSAEQINPNSYNVRLASELWVYDELELDMAKENRGRYLTIPDRGFVLEPNRLYLGVTAEYIASDHFAPMIEGRSSVGRLGCSCHAAAGFADVGWSGRLTLEIQVAQHLRVYPMVQLAQVCFHEVTPGGPLYRGKYLGSTQPMPSGLWKELQRELAGVA